jgi:hypothetical protein
MASDPKRQGRVLEEIHRQFTEVGKHAGQARNGGSVWTSWGRAGGGSTPGIPTTTREPCGGTSISHRVRVGGAGRTVLACPTTSRKALY